VDDAITSYQKTLLDKRFAGAGEIWIQVGRAYFHKGEYYESARCFEEAEIDRDIGTQGVAQFYVGTVKEMRQ